MLNLTGSGFIIRSDGSAEFNKITTRGMTAIDMTTKGLTVMERLDVELDAYLQNINGIPINQFARNHPAGAANTTDFPIGTILLAATGTAIPLNSIVNTVHVEVQPGVAAQFYRVNHPPASITQHFTLIPGVWALSGRISGGVLIRRIS